MLTGIAVRTKLIDEATGAILAEHPEGLVVNLGSGLDARSLRLDNGRALWIDLDLPEVVDLRSRLLGETERHKAGDLGQPAAADRGPTVYRLLPGPLELAAALVVTPLSEEQRKVRPCHTSGSGPGTFRSFR